MGSFKVELGLFALSGSLKVNWLVLLASSLRFYCFLFVYSSTRSGMTETRGMEMLVSESKRLYNVSIRTSGSVIQFQ